MQKKKLFIIFVIATAICLISVSAQCGIQTEAPTIKLEIYDGPDYSESDNMCYYRVEAIVSGDPKPEVEFEADDNVKSLGSDKVEVGVDIGDSYTLEVTATNLAGTATNSTVLLGECGEEVAGEEAPPEEEVAEEETAAEEEEITEGAEEEEEGVAPTIALEIYEGPTYSAADDVCYYRVKATVTGSPSPAVGWSKDDSESRWGTKKA